MQTIHITHRHIYYYLYLLVDFFAIVLWYERVVISTSVDTMFFLQLFTFYLSDLSEI